MGETRAAGGWARGFGCAGTRVWVRGWVFAGACVCASTASAFAPTQLCPFVASVPKRTGSSDSKGHTRRARLGAFVAAEGARDAFVAAERAGGAFVAAEGAGVRWRLRGALAPARARLPTSASATVPVWVATALTLTHLCPFVSSGPKRTGSGDSQGHTRRTRRGVRRTRRGAAPARRTRRGTAGAARRRPGAPGELLDASQRVPRRACQAPGALYPGDRTGL